MIDSIKIFLTYKLGGEYIIKNGEYSTATLNSGVIVTPSKLIKRPEYSEPHQKVILGEEFVNNALTLPKCPYQKGTNEYYKWFRTDIAKLLMDWKKLNNEQKIQRHIEMYVKDMTGLASVENNIHYSFNIN